MMPQLLAAVWPLAMVDLGEKCLEVQSGTPEKKAKHYTYLLPRASGCFGAYLFARCLNPTLHSGVVSLAVCFLLMN
jgi:hypothetical protein